MGSSALCVEGMPCLADLNFFGFELRQQAQNTGADLLWRMKKNMRMACEKRLSEGSYLNHVYPSERDWRHKTKRYSPAGDGLPS